MTSNTQKFRVFFGDPDLSMMFKMFLPIFIDMLLNAFIGTVHSYFVAGAGEVVISAISLVNQVNSLISAVFFAATSATIVVVAQLRGSGYVERVALVVGQTISFTVYGTAIVALLFCLFPSQVMTLFFGKIDPAILAESIKYIKLIGISLPFYVVFQTCACACRGYDEHKIPLLVSVSGSIINLFFAFLFIRVLSLGIIGAALSLIISRVYMAIVGYAVLFRRKWIAPIKDCIIVKFSVIKNILYLGFFSSTESIITSFAGTLKTGFLVPFGISHITASSVFNSFSGLLNVSVSVMGTLTTTFVAKSIGSGDGKKAREMFIKCLIYTFTMNVITWGAAYFILPYIFPYYTDNPETLRLLGYILLINAIGNPTVILFVSITRQAFNGAGDAKYSTIVSIICMLIFNLGLGYVLTVTCNLGITGSTLSGFISAFVKGIIYIFRYKSGRWENHIMV